ncbi:MAG TPA: tetraacyldisaccharide 4'-kinase [Gallionellaceae bacterium]|nr:tetraacyldisaccharide 4'-kinase [Gallionellaceae bacterium]
MARIERHWYRITPLHFILLPLSLLFGMLSAIRRALYRSGILSSEKLPVPVIVVGNITVGGSGKTPLTLWLAQQLIDEGWHPGIVSRGYRSAASSPRAVSPFDSPGATGDEPLLMAQRKLCPVWIGRNRSAAARALLDAHPECDVILSDDGLQHYRLRRDAEIAVVDGHRRFGNGFLLPAGPLREPQSRLGEVDAVVINGGATTGKEFNMRLHGEVFHNLLNPETTAQATDFSGMHLHAIAGIGHPERFFKHLENMGLAISRHPLPDHHRYTASDIDIGDADAILMTEKDAVKCVTFANEKCWVLRVDAQLDPALILHILRKIAPHGRQTA